MSNTIQLRAQNGVRNDVSPERFDRDALGRRTGFTDMSASVNLDLDETGKLARRLGTDQLIAGSAHSLYADGDEAYVVVSGTLKRLLPDMSTVSVQAVAGRVSMVRIVDTFYWSDNSSKGILIKGVPAPWGIAVPPIPAAFEGSGDLLAGTYLFAVTYVRSTGEESGAPAYGSITVSASSSITFNLPVSTDPLVTSKRLYVSDRNGDLGYLVGSYPNATTLATLATLGTPSVALRTQFMGPPPAGVIVGEFCGRALVASGNYLWYSQPYEYGLFDLRSGYVGFKSPLRTVAGVVDGVFAGTTDETFWLAGTDPTLWTLQSRASYGTVLGTEVQLINHLVGHDGASGTVMGWMSKRGLCLGFDGGEMKNVTGGRHIPPAAVEGASLLKVRDGTPQIVTTLYN